MLTLKQTFKSLGLTTALAASAFAFSGSTVAAPLPAGWTCTGNCGSMGADGVVTASPQGGDYSYVSTNGGVSDSGLGIGSETNGSRALTNKFSANAGDDLEFFFNYITSDGAEYIEYAWVRLLDDSLSQVAILFTARTTTSGDTVPGNGLPGLAPGVTLNPATTAIIPGATTWSPLGGYSGACYAGLGQGCGSTGWIGMTYEILAAGDYYLEFGVVNWLDQLYDTGLAFDGILVGGNPIPEPASLALLGIGLAGLGAMRRRKTA